LHRTVRNAWVLLVCTHADCWLGGDCSGEVCEYCWSKNMAHQQGAKLMQCAHSWLDERQNSEHLRLHSGVIFISNRTSHGVLDLRKQVKHIVDKACFDHLKLEPQDVELQVLQWLESMRSHKPYMPMLDFARAHAFIQDRNQSQTNLDQVTNVLASSGQLITYGRYDTNKTGIRWLGLWPKEEYIDVQKRRWRPLETYYCKESTGGVEGELPDFIPFVPLTEFCLVSNNYASE
jgi:hypothetical protein